LSTKNNARLVYSTDPAAKCPECGRPRPDCRCGENRVAADPIPRRVVAKLRVEKKGRGGKTVTVVDGLPQNPEFLNDLIQALKRACGTGGTVIAGGIELQGELRERLREVLAQRGYVVKG
jgi:translation initiation factor 1